MKLAEVYPDLDQRSSLPPGGDPRLDKAYSDWLRDWLDTTEPRALDALTGSDGEVCPGAAKLTARLNPFRVTGHLAKWLIGWEFPSGTGPTFCHRQRFVAVQFQLRRAALVNEANAYLERIIAELREA